MSDDPISRPTITELLKVVFWNRWGAIVGGILGIFGVLDFIDAHFAPRFPEALKSVWSRYYVLPSFGWRTWLVIVAFGLLVVAIHGAYVYAMGYYKQYQALTEHKLVFIIDHNGTRVRVDETQSGLRVFLTLNLRFDNRDIHPSHMVRLDASMVRYGIKKQRPFSDIFTYFALLGVSYNGVVIDKEAFEGMRVAERQLTQPYKVELMLGIEDEQVKRAADWDTLDTIVLKMETSGYQAPFSAYLHPYWEAALRQDGTDQISITQATSIPKDYRRLG